MRLLECRRIAHPRRIEYHEVRLQSRSDHAAVREPKALSRKRRHLAHRIFQRDGLALAHIAGEDSYESTIAARMRHPGPWRAHERHLAVGGDHRGGVAQDT